MLEVIRHLHMKNNEKLVPRNITSYGHKFWRIKSTKWDFCPICNNRRERHPSYLILSYLCIKHAIIGCQPGMIRWISLTLVGEVFIGPLTSKFQKQLCYNYKPFFLLLLNWPPYDAAWEYSGRICMHGIDLAEKLTNVPFAFISSVLTTYKYIFKNPRNLIPSNKISL